MVALPFVFSSKWQFKKQYVALVNTQHAYEQSPYVDKNTQAILQQCIQNLEKQLKKLREEMIGVVEAEYERLLKKVTSVAGISKQVGAALIEVTCGPPALAGIRLDLPISLRLRNLPVLLVYVLLCINQVKV